MINSFGDCIPALAAGNAVVLKPSEVTPLTSLLMAEMLTECGIPDGVFAGATGRGETGAALIDEVDFVMFTGSVATGKKVMARAAETLTPVSLELGGKDPMIVLADADLERAANAAVSYGLNNSGQVCISVERIYVEEPVHDEFLERLTQGRGAAPGTARGAGSVDVGAIMTPSLRKRAKNSVSQFRDGEAGVCPGERKAMKKRQLDPHVVAARIMPRLKPLHLTFDGQWRKDCHLSVCGTRMRKDEPEVLDLARVARDVGRAGRHERPSPPRSCAKSSSPWRVSTTRRPRRLFGESVMSKEHNLDAEALKRLGRMDARARWQRGPRVTLTRM